MSASHDVIDFRTRFERLRGWGTFLLAVAAVLWLWFAGLLFLPYSIEREHLSSYEACESRFTAETLHSDKDTPTGLCAAERDWPELLAVLGGSVPFAVAGSILFTVGTVNVRMSWHAESLVRQVTAEKDAS